MNVNTLKFMVAKFKTILCGAGKWN